MKHALTFLFLFGFLSGQAQNKLSPQGRLFYQDLLPLIASEEGFSQGITPAFMDKYALLQLGNTCYIGVVLLVDETFDAQQAGNMGILLGSRIGPIQSARVPL